MYFFVRAGNGIKVAWAALALSFMVACSGQRPEPATPSTEEKNRAIVLRYMQEVINERELDVLDEIMAEDWIAHNPGEPNGRAALKKFFAGMFEQFPEIQADVKRVVAEGDLVVVHSHYTGRAQDRGNDWAPGSSATADFFRLMDGMIVEHWDVVQRPIRENSINGDTIFDGGALYNYRQ